MAPKHLDEEALIRASYGVTDPQESAHLAGCAECAAAIAAFDARRLAAGRAGDAVEQLPVAFWERQRQAVLAGVKQPAAPAFRPAAAALSVALLLLLALLVVGQIPLMPRTAPVRATQVSPLGPEDEQFLYEIHTLVNRIEPRALAPAALLLPDRKKEVQQQ